MTSPPPLSTAYGLPTQQIPPSLKNERSCALGWIPSNSLRSSTKRSIASLSWLTSATAHPPISKPMTSAPWKTKLYKQYRKTLPSRSTSENTMYPRVRFYMSRRFPLRVRFLNGLTGPTKTNFSRYLYKVSSVWYKIMQQKRKKERERAEITWELL